MAMLAEKKRREKWCINPRGKQWSDDKTKFGQRLLEKMGWSAGEGLGINKQGPTEIINVRKKDNNKGLGFKETGEEWIKTTSDYNELLDQLANIEGSENGQTDITSSLEDRSKKSKARVHYHKFTRGKDLSRYSERDLASIIGPDVVKIKSDSKNAQDYTQNQINKGSSTDYFNGKKGITQLPKPELTINEEITNGEIAEEDASVVFEKKNKKKKKDKIQFSEESNVEIEETTSKKHKKRKCLEEVSHKFQDDAEVSNNEQSQKKKKKNHNEIENESKIQFKSIDSSDALNETNISSNFCTDIKEVSKRKKKTKQITNVQSVELQNEDYIYDNLPKNKSNSNHDIECIVNNPEHTDEVVHSNFNEDTSNYDIVEEESTRKHKKKKKACKDDFQHNEEPSCERKATSKKHKKQKVIEEGDGEDINNKRETKRTNKENKTETEMQFEIIEESTQFEQEIANLQLDTEIKDVSKKKKNKHLKIEDPVESEAHNPVMEPNELKDNVDVNKPKKSKRKSEYSGFDHDSVNPEFKKIKVKKQSKDNLNEDNQIGTEMTTHNDNKECLSNMPDAFLMAYGRQTRLKQINKPYNQIKSEKIETGEFMPFNGKINCSFNERKAGDSKWTNEIVESLLPKIYVDPDHHKCKMPSSVAAYEYRLLRQKIEELNIPSVYLRIIIKNNTLISKKLKKGLKLFYNSKYFKTILPKDVVADIEVAVNCLYAQLQPKINTFNELLKLENETDKLSSEIQESSNLTDAKSEVNTSNPVNKKKLKEIKKQLKCITKGVEETVSSGLENNQVEMNSSPLKYDNTNKEKENSRNDPTEECVAHTNSLQVRIEEKVKMLNNQIKLLKEGKVLPIERNVDVNEDILKSKSDHKKSFMRSKSSNSIWKEGLNNQEFSGEMSNKQKWNQSSDNLNTKTYKDVQSYQEPFSLEQAAFRGQLRGGGRGSWGMGYGLGTYRGQIRGRGSHRMGFGTSQVASRGRGRTVVRGRISKNNFDAKMYAEKCKTLNKVPEIAFKGVDLKFIPGYAADKINTNEQTPTNESSTFKKEDVT